jgi:hypothetical protein
VTGYPGAQCAVVSGPSVEKLKPMRDLLQNHVIKLNKLRAAKSFYGRFPAISDIPLTGLGSGCGRRVGRTSIGAVESGPPNLTVV